MKQIYLLAILLFISVNCKAQSPILDIENKPTIWDEPQTNAYYKDINNFYNGFEGTWLATRGNKVLKIVLTKEERVPNDIPYFADYINGEYQYLENGVEKINTLNNNDPYKKGLLGSDLLKSNHKPPCNDCDPNKRRLQVTLYDYIRAPDGFLSGTLTLQHTTVNGQPALKGLLYGDGSKYDSANPPQYFSMNVPTGWWTFIKQ